MSQRNFQNVKIWTPNLAINATNNIPWCFLKVSRVKSLQLQHMPPLTLLMFQLLATKLLPKLGFWMFHRNASDIFCSFLFSLMSSVGLWAYRSQAPARLEPEILGRALSLGCSNQHDSRLNPKQSSYVVLHACTKATVSEWASMISSVEPVQENSRNMMRKSHSQHGGFPSFPRSFLALTNTLTFLFGSFLQNPADVLYRLYRDV